MKPALFFAGLLLLMYGVTRLEWTNGNLTVISPRVVGGDEPHYLLALNTLLFHHRVELQDAYANLKTSGEAGPYTSLDHHTICVGTGRLALSEPCHSAEVSLHPMGYPLLLAGLLMPFHPKVEDVQSDASIVMVLMTWLACMVVYFVTRSLRAPMILGLASPWLVYAKSFYSETPAGLALACALWAAVSKRWKLAALACGVAAVFKPPFAVAGIGFIVERISSRDWKHATQMSGVLGLCGVALLGWNYWLAGVWLIPPLGVTAYDTHGQALYETLLGRSCGLLWFAPWVVLVATRCHRWPALMFATVVYIVVLVGTKSASADCWGPRYWIAWMPYLAVMAGDTRYHRSLFVLSAIGALIAIPAALRYQEAFYQPAWAGLW